MIEHAQPIDLLFVIAPHSLLQDIAGPAEAFRLANLRLAERGRPPNGQRLTRDGKSVVGAPPASVFQ